MKELIRIFGQVVILFAAFSVARAYGYVCGKGIEFPWYVDFAMWVAFLMLILVFQLTEDTKNETEATR